MFGFKLILAHIHVDVAFNFSSKHVFQNLKLENVEACTFRNVIMPICQRNCSENKTLPFHWSYHYEKCNNILHCCFFAQLIFLKWVLIENCNVGVSQVSNYDYYWFISNLITTNWSFTTYLKFTECWFIKKCAWGLYILYMT